MMKEKKKEAVSDAQADAAEVQIVDTMKSIDYFISEYTVEFLAQKMSKGEYEVPAYQREFTWEKKRQAKFIESILMGLPIPFLFFWEKNDTGTLEIVDGSQRIRTIQAFIEGELILNDLEKLTRLNGLSYFDLKKSRQLKFCNRSIRGIILSEKADDEARFDLFERINTGSKIANLAEIRRGALSGPFMSMIIEIAEFGIVRSMLPVSKKREDEREREELITRFFAYGDGLQNYQEKPKEFLYNYIKNMNDAFVANPSLKLEYVERVNSTFNFVNRFFPYGFKKSANGKATPRARFESLAIGSHLALKERPNLAPTPDQVADFLASEAFNEEVRSDGANITKRLVGRISIRRIQLASATPSKLNEKARWYSPLASPSNQRLRGVWAMHTLPGKNGTTSARQ